jgi:lysophospholipase L1-like esterase
MEERPTGDAAQASASEAKVWIGSWTAAPQRTEPGNMPPAPGLSGNTLRQMVMPTLSGNRIRLRLSNEFGDGAVTLRSVRFAASTTPPDAGGSSIDPATDSTLSFSGKGSVTIPAGEVRTSDPLDYPLKALSKFAISIAFDRVPEDVTGHPGSRTTSYLQSGHTPDAVELPEAAATDHWYYISGIDVLRPPASAAVVTIGDSITGGRGSTTNGNNRWPDNLARRLQATAKTNHIAVLNQGIGGNAVLKGGLGPSLLERFERDALQQHGVRWLIVLHGVNDLCTSDDPNVADALIAAYQRLIDRAHESNIHVYGVPVLPFGDSHYDSNAHEQSRQTVNNWIRTSGAFDAVIDLDKVVRDPKSPSRLLPEYDDGDQLHLSVAGYRAMAEGISLDLFGK